MKNQSRRAFLMSSTVAIGLSASIRSSYSQTVNKDPELLKTTLTPLGAERAGNADGSIPAWTGGYSTVPDGYVSGTLRPDPFADEKPVLVITAQNVSQYSDKLPQGALEMFKRFPDTYQIQVFPTHRTMAAAQEVYDNAYQNVTRATISADGEAVSNAYGAPAFPIPSSGFEVIWNHNTSWQGVEFTSRSTGALITAEGQKIYGTAVVRSQSPFYYPGGSPTTFSGIYRYYLIQFLAPPYQAGTQILQVLALNQAQHAPKSMEYEPGQRRVRQAPDIGHDTPNFSVDGVANFDEAFVYYGRMDQYDFKLLGKKEMYIPYNVNGATLASVDNQLGAQHYNPALLRWELHRVWVVEMTLLPNARNVDARRLLYVDEDSWIAVMGDAFDASGSYWKFSHAMPVLCYDLPGIIALGGILYDLHKGDYCAFNLINPQSGSDSPKFVSTPGPEDYYSANTMVSMAGGQ